MTTPLEKANYLEEHSIRPHSLKVTAISALATEIVKGNANLAQLSVQGNYRAATAQDMRKIYSRNIAQQQLFASKFARKSVKENQNAEFLPIDLPAFGELQNQGDSSKLAADVRGGNRGNVL